MRTLLMFALILCLSATAMAFDLDAQRPAKPHITYPQNVPVAGRQGGDTIADAVVVTVPYSGTGTTEGFNDDYDEVCPYTGSTSPDVVYSVTPGSDMILDIDLLGSGYDTKIYVYDADMNLIACNDDYWPDYISRIESVDVVGATEYFIVIDGYGGDAGEYVLSISEVDPCQMACPTGAPEEGEPALVDGYVDEYNSGCGAPAGVLLQTINSHLFCGTSGWYLGTDGSQYRDTDWFEVTIPASGVLEIMADAYLPTYVFELGPQDCNDVGVLQDITVGPCESGSLTINGASGDTAWIWVGPTTFEGPVNEYLYVLWLNLPVATETHSWSSVKSLFQ